jgi:DNA-3-methyladenine glycosylase
MFGSSGHLYVYFTYGMHHCCNIVTGEQGTGSAVLIRAVEPLEGATVLEARRHKLGVEITNGPAKLCQALQIDKLLNGHDLRQMPLRLIAKGELPAGDIITTTRIGISQAKDEPRRWYIKDNPYVSRP